MNKQKLKSVKTYLNKHHKPLDEFFWVSNILAELGAEGKLDLEDLDNFAISLEDDEPKQHIREKYYPSVNQETKYKAMASPLDFLEELPPGVSDEEIERFQDLISKSQPGKEPQYTELQKMFLIMLEEIDSKCPNNPEDQPWIRIMFLHMFGDKQNEVLKEFDDTIE